MTGMNMNERSKALEGIRLSAGNAGKLTVGTQSVHAEPCKRDKVSIVVCGRVGYEAALGFMLGENLADAIMIEPELDPYAIMRTAISVNYGDRGVLLICGMVTYIVVLVVDALKKRDTGDEVKTMSPLKSVLCIAGGLAAIIVGGDLVVDSACDIAAAFGMSEALIGLTIVAAGTSLPELVTSIVAAKKGDSGLALGNVVGSNIFNILFILGSASALTTINVAPELFIDTAILIAVTLFMYFLCRSKDKTSRGEGALCVLVYAAYMAYIILR